MTEIDLTPVEEDGRRHFEPPDPRLHESVFSPVYSRRDLAKLALQVPFLPAIHQPSR